MNKPLFILQSPLWTRSGYGDLSLAVAKSLLRYNKFDLRLAPTVWGACSKKNLSNEVNDPEGKELLSRVLQGNLNKQPEVFMQITIPNEFQTPAKFNIGYTAGIETTVPRAEWLEGLNRMNLNIVTSIHARDVFAGANYTKKNPNGTTEPLVVKTPMEVLFWGANISIYGKNGIASLALEDTLKDIPETFAFLFVGQWTSNNIRGDRKAIGYLIKTFLETFADVPNPPCLILKTSGAQICIMDKYECINKIHDVTGMVKQAMPTAKLPNVYLLHGELEDNEMNALYNHEKVKVHVSFTHGEGFCVLGDTPIITKTGLKNIKDITNKDEVFTHCGRWKNVISPLSRHYIGEMKKISVYNGINSIQYQFTPNHSCYVYRNEEWKWISANDLKLSDYLLLPKGHNLDSPTSLKISKTINCPNIKLQDEKLTYIHSNKTTIKNIKDTIQLTPEFAKICGYFLSEGCFSNGEIIFSINKTEEQTIGKELVECFKNVFGVDTYSIKPHKTKNSLKVIFHSVIVGEFLTALFGKGAIHKSIPIILKNASAEFVENMISSIFIGDGCFKNNKCISLQLVNDILIRDIRECLLKLDIFSCHDIKENNKFNAPVSRIRISNYNSNRKIIYILNKNHNFCDIKLPNNKYLSRGGTPKSLFLAPGTTLYHAFKIKTIESVKYEGIVYNLSVEEDESYCTENFIVHNCHPALLQSLSGKPMIYPKWSGHLDFLNPNYTKFFDGSLVPIPDEAVNDWFVKDARWFEVDYIDAGRKMKRYFTDYNPTLLEEAEKLRVENNEKFSLQAMDKAFHAILDKYVPQFAMEENFVLPKLKKLTLPKLSDIPTPGSGTLSASLEKTTAATTLTPAK